MPSKQELLLESLIFPVSLNVFAHDNSIFINILFEKYIKPTGIQPISLFSIDKDLAQTCLVFDNFSEFSAKKHELKAKVTFLCCDIAHLNGLEQQYQAWCELRKYCDFLLIRAFAYGDFSFLHYDFKTYTHELSFVFPVYNVAGYLEKCFENFISFPHDFVEFLAVNDGATDHSRAVLHDIQQRDARIQILDKPNGGCASARAFGLRQAKGRYVAFIDPDDFVEPQFIEKLHIHAVFSQCQVVQCGYNHYYHQTKETSCSIEDSRLVPFFHKPYFRDTPDYSLYRINQIGIWRRLYAVSFLKENNIQFHEQIRRFDDLPFFFEVFSLCTSFLAIPDALYNYRLERPGQDMSVRDERLFVHFDIFNILNDFYHQVDNKNEGVLTNLLLARMSSHRFGLHAIEKRLLNDYMRRMFDDFNIHRQAFVKSVLALRKHYGKFWSSKMLMFFGIALRWKWLVKLVNKRLFK
jgi:glycosyltransferase involved in cell wall biosynthesis